MKLPAVIALLFLPTAVALAQSSAPPADETNQPAQVWASVDRPRTYVADPIQLTIRVAAPSGTEVRLPLREQDALGQFQVQRIQAQTDLPDPHNRDLRNWIWTVTIDTLRSGDLVIPSQQLEYRLPDDSAVLHALQTSEIPVQVISLLDGRADPTDFRDIKPAIELTSTDAGFDSLLLWLPVGLAGSGLLVAMVLVARRRRPTISAAQWALSKIASLESTVRRAGCDAGTLYGELAMIIREYLAIETATGHLSMSSDELLRRVNDTNRISPAAHRQLGSFLSRADEVRFARLGQSTDEIAAAIDQARQVVIACAGSHGSDDNPTLGKSTNGGAESREPS